MVQRIQATRRHDYDWLRVGTVMLLIPYHTARIFDSIPFYVKYEPASLGLEILRRSFDPWGMSLLFFIAGASAWFSIQNRTSVAFTAERVKRLLVPLVFGLLIIIPPQTYCAMAGKIVGFQKSFFAYYPDFFAIKGLDSLDGFEGTFTPGHLWFIFYLFLFSVIALPVFRLLSRERTQVWMGNLALICVRRPWCVYVFAVPLILARLSGVPYPNPLFFFLLFLYGYVFLSNHQFQKAEEKAHPATMILSLLSFLVFHLIELEGYDPPPGLSFAPEHVMVQMILGFNTWVLVLLLLGLARKFLCFSHRALNYLNEASYPVYILHQTVIVVVGFYIVRSEANVYAKFALITLSSTLLIFALYELAVRRTRITRFLFGLK